ncbi:MAG: GNAT family N-acetyltransferase [Pseudomonadota bacterium]
MTVVVRPLAASDYSAWSGLWTHYNAFYGRSGETALHDDVVATTWARLLENDEPVYGLLAVLDDLPVGLAHFVFHMNLIQIAETCYLQDLFTTPFARGHGVARTLLGGVYDDCRKRGVRDVYWHTHEGNSAARSLYDKVARNTGFIVYRTNVD